MTRGLQHNPNKEEPHCAEEVQDHNAQFVEVSLADHEQLRGHEKYGNVERQERDESPMLGWGLGDRNPDSSGVWALLDALKSPDSNARIKLEKRLLEISRSLILSIYIFKFIFILN